MLTVTNCACSLEGSASIIPVIFESVRNLVAAFDVLYRLKGFVVNSVVSAIPGNVGLVKKNHMATCSDSYDARTRHSVQQIPKAVIFCGHQVECVVASRRVGS